MPRVKIEQLAEGMIVVSDVKNIHDMLLIPAGCALTERQIGILQAWGVEQVEVQHSKAIEEADPLARLSPETLAKINQEITELFWEPDDSDPVYVELRGILLQRRARGSGVTS